MTTLRLGTFEAQRFWRPADLAVLPRAPSSSPVVEHLDEILAGFCEPGDLRVTRGPMATGLREHLAEAGLRFEHRRSPFTPRKSTVEQGLLGAPDLGALTAGCDRLSPYAVLPGTAELAKRRGLDGTLPGPEVVARSSIPTVRGPGAA